MIICYYSSGKRERKGKSELMDVYTFCLKHIIYLCKKRAMRNPVPLVSSTLAYSVFYTDVGIT